MWSNVEFGREFPAVDLLCIVPELLGVVLISLYMFLKDSKCVRRGVPWAFLLVSVANLLVPSWMMIYIYAIYKKDEVHNDMNLTGDPEVQHRHFKSPLTYLRSSWHEKGHFVETADAYVVWHSVFCYVEAAITFFISCLFMNFEERKNAEEPDNESSDETDY